MLEELREIGFNEDVTLGDRVMHVQTEIMGRDTPIIKTTVMEGGALRSSEDQPCPVDRSLDEIRDAASNQHRRCVERIARGEVA